jgi:hypothetical protein
LFDAVGVLEVRSGEHSSFQREHISDDAPEITRQSHLLGTDAAGGYLCADSAEFTPCGRYEDYAESDDSSQACVQFSANGHGSAPL